MASTTMSSLLYERIPRKNTLQRLTDLTIFFLLLSLLFYRFCSLHSHGLTWFLAFLCELWFTFTWLLVMNSKWTPVEHKTHPQHLLQRIDDLPPVDVFVTTADPVLEPPIITVNTVLSLLALDYPANKLACYVSDDGASPITFYALVEAVKFAKLWVPFCKKHSVAVRAPFRYFSAGTSSANGSPEFLQECTHVKNEYKLLLQKIEEAEQNPASCDFEAFSKAERLNHSTIIQVLWENKEVLADGVPHLVYVSREKQPKHPHHFKAGAMNVLSFRNDDQFANNADVDCDMFANNPQIVLHAMCFLLGTEKEKEIAYVQFPQLFYGGHKDDPFGNQLIALQEFLGHGIEGIQGPFYSGTGCFHQRKIIYGLSPDESIETRVFSLSNVKSLEEVKKRFGHSTKFAESAVKSLSGLNEGLCCPSDITSSLKEAIQVADVRYESNTEWGAKVGWMYGSTTEDVQTGLRIQSKGWRSVYCTPDVPGFLGCAPSGGPACMIQQTRWVTGLLEIFFTANSPILCSIFGNLRFRQCLSYLHINLWGARSLPEICYPVLPAYCLLTNTYFMPSVLEPEILIPASLLLIYNIYALSEYLSIGLPARAWWNNQRMSRIISTTAWLSGLLSVVLKLLKLSETVFHVTPKEQTNDSDDHYGSDADPGRFTFDESPVFVPGTAVVLLHLGAVSVSLSRGGVGLGEMVCSSWVLLSFMPFVKGLFRRGKYGIPWSTVCKSGVLVGIFVGFCMR